MLDIRLVREKPSLIRDMLSKRGIEFPLEKLLSKDSERRKILTEVQAVKHKRNLFAEKIAKEKKNGVDVSGKILEMREISQKLELLDEKARRLDEEVFELTKLLPNIPHESVPIGKNESDNQEVRRWGVPTPIEFTIKDHIDLGLSLDLIDIDRAAKVSGSRFYYLKNELVRLNYALISFTLDFIQEKGFTLTQPPYMLRREAMEGAIILSDFEDVIYKIENEDLYLIGTSEHALAAMHMGEVLPAGELPLRYAGVSPCFRKEAGAHGRDTKGIFRVHQFEKVEQFVFSKPEESWDEHEKLLQNAEEILQFIKIPYRVVTLCTGDLGKVSAKTYDIEAWFPGQDCYREVVSCSNCTDYQARKLGVKFRDKPHEASQFVHTLNSTLVATERTLIALMENNQQSDGSILIPKVLIPYFGGRVSIIPKKRSTA